MKPTNDEHFNIIHETIYWAIYYDLVHTHSDGCLFPYLFIPSHNSVRHFGRGNDGGFSASNNELLRVMETPIILSILVLTAIYGCL